MREFQESLRIPYALFKRHEAFIRGIGDVLVTMDVGTNAVILVTPNAFQLDAIKHHIDLPVTDISTGETRPLSAFKDMGCGECRTRV